MQQMTDKEDKYATFACDIPSDYVAYRYLDDRVMEEIGTGSVLEFGCHHGDRARMLESYGHDVIAVDKSVEAVEQARKNYPRLRSEHVPSDEPIELEAKIDAAYMTFVHPTVDNEEELQGAFQKTADVLKPGNPLAVLGLHDRSLQLLPPCSARR